MILAAFLGALAFATTSLSVSTAFLALALAAVTEMVTTAKVMHLDTDLIAAFLAMRICIICSTILLTYRLYERLSGDADTFRI